MRRFALAVVVTVAVLSILSFAQKIQSVVVTNAATDPVPVTVQNTPTVNINSMPTVALGSGATVSIDPSSVVKTTSVDARNIVRLYAAGNNEPGESTGESAKTIGTSLHYYVPAGKRLVINNISANTVLPPNQKVLVMVTTYQTVGQTIYQAFTLNLESHPTITFSLSGTTVERQVANSTGPIYVDAGQDIGVVVARSAGSPGTYDFWVALQGYLVDCGSSGCSQ